MKRLGLALVALVVLVAAAFGVRELRSGGATEGDDANPVTVLCATEMADACADLADAALEIRIESPAVTLGRLDAGEALGTDAWLAPRPWVDLARSHAAAAGRVDPLGATSETLARSPLALIIRSDRRAALESACAGVIDWTCLARHAGADWTSVGGAASWGRITVGVDDPDRATSGLLAMAQMAASFVRREPFDVRDLDASESTLRTTLAALAPPGEQEPLTTMLERDGAFDAAFALDAGSRLAIASPRASGQLELVDIGPATTADAVLAMGATANVLVDHGAVQRALTANGWHFPDKAASGVPDPGTVDALRALWRDSRQPR